MKNIADVLDADDIEVVARLIDTLDRSNCDFLQVEVGNLRLTLGKGEPPIAGCAPAAVMPRAAERTTPAAAASAGASRAVTAPQPAVKATTEEAGNTITAPIVGRFYARPEPAAEPFVKVGSVVEENTTVALIEVMKMFTSIPAGVRGVVTEIFVADGEFVEFGQPLFQVEPQ